MPAMSETIGAAYEFGSFRLDAARRLLIQNDRTLTLQPKTFDLLILLVESRGRVLTKKELMSALWPDTFVEEANLTFHQLDAKPRALGAFDVEGGVFEIPCHLLRDCLRFSKDLMTGPLVLCIFKGTNYFERWC